MLKVKSMLSALEQHLRISGLGAVELRDLSTNSSTAPVDLSKLASERGPQTQSSFQHRQRSREAALAVVGVLKASS